MKYWRGYLTAAIFGAITWALLQLGQKYSVLVDMVYPYVTRSIQSFLTAWTAGAAMNVWQLALVVGAVIAVAALVLVVIFKRSVIQWLGWVAAAVSLVIMLNTALYGLNYYQGPIEEDLRLEMADYTQTELEAAASFYRDKANALSVQIPRDEQGDAQFSSFEELAQLTGNGYRHLVLDRFFSIYGGDYTPVKKLGWDGFYTARGISGYTCYLTGEAAVNPNIPAVEMPFVMAREMAHRLCIAEEHAADFSAFLACEASESVEYQYSGYFMAYRFCIEALRNVDAEAAARIAEGCVNEFKWDLDAYNRFYDENRTENGELSLVGSLLNGSYFAPADEAEQNSDFGVVCDYLVNWHLAEYATAVEEEIKFDPYDETQVDLSGIANAKPAPAPEE